MANLTKCMICGNAYSYCPTCAGTHAWRFYTDTHEHYQIYVIIEQYSQKLMTKEDACEAFERLGITQDTELTGIKESIAKQIKDIVSVEEKSVIKKPRKSKLYKDE